MPDAEFDGGVYFFRPIRSHMWHVYGGGSGFTCCDVRISGLCGDVEHILPEGAHMCSDCLRKLQKALGGQYRIVKDGD